MPATTIIKELYSFLIFGLCWQSLTRSSIVVAFLIVITYQMFRAVIVVITCSILFPHNLFWAELVEYLNLIRLHLWTLWTLSPATMFYNSSPINRLGHKHIWMYKESSIRNYRSSFSNTEKQWDSPFICKKS